MIDDVIRLLEYGFAVHPLKPRDKAPALADWQSRRWTAATLRAWWAAHPDANVGLVCGATGIVALDLDGDVWMQWARETLPPTPLRTVSGSGHGGHLYYRWPIGVPVKKRRIDVPGLPDSRRDKNSSHQGGDLYGDGAQVVLPPSVHPSGGLYRWAFDGPLPLLDTVPFFDLDWLPSKQQQQPALAAPTGTATTATRATTANTALRRAAAWMQRREPAVAGQRGDDHTFTTCCQLVRDFGLAEADAWDLLTAWNASCQPPWTEAKLRQKLRSAMTSGTAAVGSKPDRGGAKPVDLRAEAAAWRADGTATTATRATTATPATTTPAPVAPAGLVLPRVGARGPLKDHIDNTRALLSHHGVRCRYNLMTHQLEVDLPDVKYATERRANATVSWVENRAADAGLSRLPVVAHLQELAAEYHPVAEWIASRPWDGRDRIPEIAGTLELQAGADASFCGTLLWRWLLGAAASIRPQLEGEFAAQGVLVLQGDQGRGKTRWLRSLAPPRTGWVLTGRSIDPRDRDSVQVATSVWLCELGEVDATFRRSDVAALKAFVTQESDSYRSAYARREERVQRRTVFMASVNEPEYLVDRTGNRRWWTLPIARCNADHHVDLQQLWAQLVAAVDVGERWWLDDDELEALRQVNAEHEPEDPLGSELRAEWSPSPVYEVDGAGGGRSLSEVFRALPSFEDRAPSPVEAHRLVAELRAMGVRSHRTSKGRVYFVVSARRALGYSPDASGRYA